MKKLLINTIVLLTTVTALAKEHFTNGDKLNPVEPSPLEPIAGIILPILFIGFLVFMLITLIKYFLEFRLKNKLIERGMSEQLSAYLSNKNSKERQHDAMKLAILFCGVGAGLAVTYLTTPIDIHSIAIMVSSVGLSYLVYFFYLRR